MARPMRNVGRNECASLILDTYERRSALHFEHGTGCETKMKMKKLDWSVPSLSINRK